MNFYQTLSLKILIMIFMTCIKGEIKIADRIDFLVEMWMVGLHIGAEILLRCAVNSGSLKYFLLLDFSCTLSLKLTSMKFTCMN